MKYYIYIIMSALLLVACEQEIGEFTDYEAPRLVVNALITAGGENQLIRIRQTGITHVSTVTGAEVSMAVNGEEVFSLISDGEDALAISHNDFRPGDVVTISAHKGEMHASASAMVQEPVIITGVDTMLVKVKSSKWSQELEPHTRYMVHLRLPEGQPRETRYFRVEVVKDIHTTRMSGYDEEQGCWVIGSVNTDTDHSRFSYAYDPALCETENADQEDYPVQIDWLAGVENLYHVFSSNFFKEGEYTLRLDLPHNLWFAGSGGWDQHVRIRIYSISKTEYHYLQALSAAKYYERDVITNGEPMVPSNVTGGAGIFCVESVAEISFYENHFTYPQDEHLHDFYKPQE